MTVKEEQTYWIEIHVSGPVHVVEQVCREDFLNRGLCVTITPIKFIYSGGEEMGCVVGLINYPRFPKSPEDIWERANSLADLILKATAQHSILVMDPNKTRWVTVRPGQ